MPVCHVTCLVGGYTVGRCVWTCTEMSGKYNTCVTFGHRMDI